MSEQFFAEPAAGPSPLGDLRVDQQDNPFRTDAYVEAMRRLGYGCWVLGIRTNGTVSDAAVATVKRGRLGARLEIPSLPRVAQTSLFWDGVYALSKHLGITDLIVETFGSPTVAVPNLRGETERKNRSEYVISAASVGSNTHICSSHLKNIKKARGSGVALKRGAVDQESMAQHTAMIEHSMARRAARGEAVPANTVDGEACRAYVRSGAGELFQAVYDGKVVSSILLLRSTRAAYNESAGTNAEGMRIGASSFLLLEACRELFGEGVSTFNLGGAPEGSTLARFKAGLGASEVHLCACASYLGPRWVKCLRSVARFARVARYVPASNRPETGSKLPVST